MTDVPRHGRGRLLLGPLAFLAIEAFVHPALPDGQAESARHALAATAWIAVWWMTEAVPIAITSLLPLALFPILGLGSAADTARCYGDDVVFLFLGGLLLAQAMVQTGLHERIARRITGAFGSEPRSLVLGFMVATAAVSMWLSNTATTVMMLPVAVAVLDSKRAPGDARGVDAPLATALVLGIAFAANIGGFGTPIGSPPAVVFQSVYRSKTGIEVGFGEWMLYGVPLIVVLLPLTWWWLTRRLAAGRSLPQPEPEADAEPWTGDQMLVAAVFGSAAALWITRSPLGPFPGWGEPLARLGPVVGDSTVAVAAVLLLVAISTWRRRPVLEWNVASRELPWGVLLLMGAGFALSQAFDRSGLTLWLGDGIAGIASLHIPPALLYPAVIVSVVGISIVVTEFASNTASASILLPVIYGACAALASDSVPADLAMVACALASTAGFAMPAGTPPNALAFATGRVSIQTFARTGLVIDAISLLVISGMILAWYFLR